MKNQILLLETDGEVMVKRMLLFSVTLLCFVISISAVSSFVVAEGEVGVQFSPSDIITINASETDLVDIIIVNSQDVDDTFSISIWPTSDPYITPTFKSNIKVDANSEGRTKLLFVVSPDAPETVVTFSVTAKSKSNSEIIDDADVKVKVLKQSSIYISDVSLDKYMLDLEECVNITSSITNLGSASGPYKLITRIRKTGNIIKEFEDSISIVGRGSTESVSNYHCFEKYDLSGPYSMSSILKTPLNEQVDARSAYPPLRIIEKSDLVYKKTVVYTPFAQIKTIKVTNEGNSIERNFYITETVSNFVDNLFYPIDQPSATQSSESKIMYSWIIDELVPSGSISIQYEIRYISIWFSGLVIALITFLAFSYVYSARIKKRFTLIGALKKGKEIPILLEVKNSTIYEIKNIIVKDRVPPIATLLERFDTMTPTIKKTNNGTELTWKIKSLKPLEERVLTYRLKPNVDIIGSMRLPKAIMDYVSHKKEDKSVSSKTIEMK